MSLETTELEQLAVPDRGDGNTTGGLLLRGVKDICDKSCAACV